MKYLLFHLIVELKFSLASLHWEFRPWGRKSIESRTLVGLLLDRWFDRLKVRRAFYIPQSRKELYYFELWILPSRFGLKEIHGVDGHLCRHDFNHRLLPLWLTSMDTTKTCPS
jgi:hypothetical protein